MRRLTLSLCSLALLQGGLCLASPDAPAVAVHPTHGVLDKYDPGTRLAIIAHDAIPGYMPAMTMPFKVRDADIFAHLHRGDILNFDLCVTASDAWIDHAVKTGAAAPDLLQSPTPSLIRELAVGDSCPDVHLMDQSGNTFHVAQFKGQAVVLTFFYTGCPLPNYCPLLNQKFARIQDLMTRLASGDKWRLLTISMDPAHDTPQLLAVTAKGYHADPAHWTFATGDVSQITKFGTSLGLQFQRSNGRIYHNLRTIVLDPSGRIYSTYSGNTWTPQNVALDLRSSMRNSAVTRR